ncbi:MAG: alpha-L-arabinofuranosidase, partial [Flavisolibacter sp.]
MKSRLTIITFIFSLIYVSCNKKSYNSTSNTGNNDTTFKQPVDPDVTPTIGFFLNDWTPRSFTIPNFTDTTMNAGNITSFVSIDASNIITKIPQTVFGQNANIWMTPIVTENVLMGHLKDLHPGIIRFPGGSLSDVYFWNADPGKYPSDAPDSLIDANGVSSPAGYWYGKNTANWTMTLDNYYSLLQQLGTQGIITVNYAYARYGTSDNPVSAAAHLAADWVRYDNGRTKYWEVGNEDNGTWEASYRINTANNKDGQPEIITGDLYGQHFKVFADSMRKAASEIGKTIYIGAQLLEKQPESWQTNTDKSWNQGVLSEVNSSTDFYIVHSYYTPYQQNSTADVILNTATDNTMSMMNYLKSSFTTYGAAPKPIALTEWNITSQGSMQQVSFISGIHSVLLLGEALKNKYGETSRWDLANGWNNGNDMGLFNIGDEPGVSKWNPRPSFYYMYYFNQYIGDRLLNTTITGSTGIQAYASSFSSGEKGIILVNKGTSVQGVNIQFQNFKPGNRFYWYTLSGGTDNGEFSQ